MKGMFKYICNVFIHSAVCFVETVRTFWDSKMVLTEKTINLGTPLLTDHYVYMLPSDTVAVVDPDRNLSIHLGLLPVVEQIRYNLVQRKVGVSYRYMKHPLSVKTPETVYMDKPTMFILVNKYKYAYPSYLPRKEFDVYNGFIVEALDTEKQAVLTPVHISEADNKYTFDRIRSTSFTYAEVKDCYNKCAEKNIKFLDLNSLLETAVCSKFPFKI